MFDFEEVWECLSVGLRNHREDKEGVEAGEKDPGRTKEGTWEGMITQGKPSQTKRDVFLYSV